MAEKNWYFFSRFFIITSNVFLHFRDSQYLHIYEFIAWLLHYKVFKTGLKCLYKFRSWCLEILMTSYLSRRGKLRRFFIINPNNESAVSQELETILSIRLETELSKHFRRKKVTLYSCRTVAIFLLSSQHVLKQS